jgi:hypothetical protein
MRKSNFGIVLFSIVCIVLLAACKQSSTPIVSSNEVDKAVILVENDKGQELKWEAEDPNFLKTLIGNLNLVFGKDDGNAQNFDQSLTQTQKNFKYEIEFYDKDKSIQVIKILQENKVTIGKKEYTVDENNEDELNSLKNHLLTVVE